MSSRTTSGSFFVVSSRAEFFFVVSSRAKSRDLQLLAVPRTYFLLQCHPERSRGTCGCSQCHEPAFLLPCHPERSRGTCSCSQRHEPTSFCRVIPSEAEGPAVARSATNLLLFAVSSRAESRDLQLLAVPRTYFFLQCHPERSRGTCSCSQYHEPTSFCSVIPSEAEGSAVARSATNLLPFAVSSRAKPRDLQLLAVPRTYFFLQCHPERSRGTCSCSQCHEPTSFCSVIPSEVEGPAVARSATNLPSFCRVIPSEAEGSAVARSATNLLPHRLKIALPLCELPMPKRRRAHESTEDGPRYGALIEVALRMPLHAQAQNDLAMYPRPPLSPRPRETTQPVATHRPAPPPPDDGLN